jgi:Rieske Fe-S protein
MDRELRELKPVPCLLLTNRTGSVNNCISRPSSKAEEIAISSTKVGGFMARAPESARRHWLLRVLQGSITVTVAAIFYPVVRFLWPRPVTSSGELEVVAPYRLDELRPGADGKWPPPFNFGGKPCLVIRTVDGEVKAFNAICTHVDCTVEYRADEGDVFCNCHNGVYDINGGNVSGPPPRPLETYKVILRGEAGKEEIVVSRAT